MQIAGFYQFEFFIQVSDFSLSHRIYLHGSPCRSDLLFENMLVFLQEFEKRQTDHIAGDQFT
jgi:hypothetical protein